MRTSEIEARMKENSTEDIAALRRRRAALALMAKAVPSELGALSRDIADADAELEKLQTPDSLRDSRPASRGYVGRSLVGYSRGIAPVIRSLVEPLKKEITELRQRVSDLEQNAAKEGPAE